jgi:hypothetical protein
MVHYAASTSEGRRNPHISPPAGSTAETSAELGEPPCRFNVYNQVQRLTTLAFIGKQIWFGIEKGRLASVVVTRFALHSPSARPIEIRRRFSFLLPPLFAPGRCAASLCRAAVMFSQDITAAFVLVHHAEQPRV